LSSFSFINFYVLLIFSISSVLREQWIRAKYERKEFIDGAPEQKYLTGRMKNY